MQKCTAETQYHFHTAFKNFVRKPTKFGLMETERAIEMRNKAIYLIVLLIDTRNIQRTVRRV